MRAKVRAAALYLVLLPVTFLAGYGGAYGFANRVFVVAAALVVILAIAEWRTFRRALVLPMFVALMGVFFVIVGYPTIALPVCPPPPGTVACAAAGARERTFVALGVAAVGVVLTVVSGVLVRPEPPAAAGVT